MTQSIDATTPEGQKLQEDIRARYAAQKEELLGVARRYAEAGLSMLCLHSAVCNNAIKRGKAPTLSLWQKNILSPDELVAELERTYRKEGGANLGIKTGKHSGIVCIDVDTKDGGMAWFQENEDRLGSFILERTGSGGLHLYYRFPRGLDTLATMSAKRRLFQGIDILADGHGQAVTWPSLHPTTGMPYEFHNGMTLLDVEHEADELPGWIVEEVLQAMRRAEIRKDHEQPALTGSTLPADIFNARRDLMEMPPAIQGQSGDDQTLRAAMRCRDYGLSEKEALQLLMETYNPRCRPPWTREEMWQKVKNAWKYAKSPRGSSSVSVTFPGERAELEEAAEAAEEAEGAAGVAGAAGRYDSKRATVSALAYLEAHPGMTLAGQGRLYRYKRDEARWAHISDSEFESVIQAAIERDSPAVFQKLKMSHLSDIRKAIKNKLQGEQPDKVFEPDRWLDGRKGEYVALANGILNIETGELLPHDPRFFSFTTLEFDYNPEAMCPTFQRFLDDIWEDDKELQESLRLWMGYLLIGTAKFQKFAMLKGESRGGKGTISRVMERLVGERNRAGGEISTFATDFGMEQLVGKRLAIFPEVDRSDSKHLNIAVERIKMITGCDTVSINRKNREYLSTKLPVKIVLTCNEIPQFPNARNSFTNRMLVFPFVKTFEGREDPDLDEKLRRELPGIFNWALEGARRLLAGGFLSASESSQTAKKEIELQLSQTLYFISDCITVTGMPHNRATNNEIWEAYLTWSRENHRGTKGRQKFFNEFAAHMRDKAEQYITGHIRGYKGILVHHADQKIDDSEPPF